MQRCAGLHTLLVKLALVLGETRPGTPAMCKIAQSRHRTIVTVGNGPISPNHIKAAIGVLGGRVSGFLVLEAKPHGFRF
jgi:hypothetical protein